MHLETFVPQTMGDGDRVKAQDMVGKAMIVHVKSRKEGIKTPFNSDPQKNGYKAEGGPALMLDIADLSPAPETTLYLDVMWMNDTIVDQWTPYVGKTIAVKLVWQNSAKGNAFLSPTQLEGQEQAYASSWANANSNAFDQERAKRAANPAQAAVPPPVDPWTGQQATLPQPPTQAPQQPPAAPPQYQQPPQAPPAYQPPAAPPPAAPPAAPPPPAAGGANLPAGITPEMLKIMADIQAGKFPQQ